MRSRSCHLVVALCLSGTAIAGCSPESTAFERIQGVVRDARTRRPVPGAKVSVDGGTRTAPPIRTGATGAFGLRDVERRSVIVVTAANYEAAEIKATSTDLVVSLQPLPVAGSAVDRSTQKPINVTVHGADLVRGSKRGTFSLFGIGPGGVVTARAAGFRPQKFRIDDSRRLMVSLEPTDETYRLRDLPLIKALWRARSDAWAGGGPQAAAAEVDLEEQQNYPGIVPEGIRSNCDYRPDRVARSYSEEYVLNVDSVERDDAWVMNFGSLTGQKPNGRVYIMQVTTSFDNGAPQQVDELHVAVLRGRAYAFTVCH